MKKIALLVIVILSTTVSFSQSWSDELQFGLRGGLNLSNVSGDDIDDPDSRKGFYAGFLVEAPVSERVSLQPEIFYAQQGIDLADQENQEDSAFKVDYIQVPLLFKIYLIDGLNIHAGPQFGFKINEEIDLNSDLISINMETDAVKDFDFQLTGGLEYKFGEIFFVQGRYYRGFTPVYEDADIYNSVWSFGVGATF